MCLDQLKPTLRIFDYKSHWYKNQKEKGSVCRYIHQICRSRIDYIGHEIDFHILTVIQGNRDLV